MRLAHNFGEVLNMLFRLFAIIISREMMRSQIWYDA